MLENFVEKRKQVNTEKVTEEALEHHLVRGEMMKRRYSRLQRNPQI